MSEAKPEPNEPAWDSYVGPYYYQGVRVRGLLSFAPDAEPFLLKPLNVLIGPNGSGKSNLIEVFGLLRASATDLLEPFRRGGGIREWLHKKRQFLTAEVELFVVDAPKSEGFKYSFGLFESEDRAQRSYEEILFVNRVVGPEFSSKQLYVNDLGNVRFLQEEDAAIFSSRKQTGASQRFSPSGQFTGSIFELGMPHPYNWIEKRLRAIRIYRNWQFGRESTLRQSCLADEPSSYLAEDLSNFAAYMSAVLADYGKRQPFLEFLKAINPGINDVRSRLVDGRVQLLVTEGEVDYPASRLSDGTLRYMALLGILLNPEPGGLICLEEPELGLHPDMLTNIAALLIHASKVTQLVVTTHSDILVDALSEQPESLVVCEKEDGQTKFRRLTSEEVRPAADKDGLGRMWLSGHLGGVPK